MAKKNIFIFGIAIVFVLGAGAGYFYFGKTKEMQGAPAEKEYLNSKITYVNFLAETYKTIKENYWEKISDEELSEIFRLGAEKLASAPQNLASKNKIDAMKMAEKIIKTMKTEEEKENFSAGLANIVLANLKPFGRSGLYTQSDEKTLENRIKNVNPQTGDVEPTVLGEIFSPEIFYLKIKQFSLATFDELQKSASEADAKGGEKLKSLVLDLRGNVGGSIDILPYFLGPFIGIDQYAYEFYHQGEKMPFKTLVGWFSSLVRYKKVIVLIDSQTQSSAEVAAAVLKKYNVGVLVGVPTRGWGTVEKVFELKNQISSTSKYSIFLVHSLTLREDSQPIESRGVEPMVYTDNPNWKEELFSYFNDKNLIDSVEKILGQNN